MVFSRRSGPNFQGSASLQTEQEAVVSKVEPSVTPGLSLLRDFSSAEQNFIVLVNGQDSLLVVFTSFSEVEVVALAAPEPFSTFFEDRVVLISLLGFTLKVTSDFHCGKELVLPTYAPSASPHQRLLDIGTSLRDYLQASESIQKSDHLFVILNGVKKCHASGRMIASWLNKVISLAY